MNNCIVFNFISKSLGDSGFTNLQPQ